MMRGYSSRLQTQESALSPELARVLVAGFVEEKGCVLLASEANDSTLTRAATQDETGYVSAPAFSLTNLRNAVTH